MRRFLAALLFALAPACSGGDFDVGSTPTDAAPQDNGSDTTVFTDTGPADAATPGAIKCGPQVCPPGQACCVAAREAGVELSCAVTCGPDAGAPIRCDGPEDCPSSAKYCCGIFAIGPGSFPYCPRSVVGSECNAACATSIPFTCPNTGRVKMCHKRADCADDTSAPECCAVSDRGVSTTVCVPAAARNSGVATDCAP